MAEVGKIGWFNYENSMSLIRPYNIEKVEIIKNINNALLEYRLIS